MVAVSRFVRRRVLLVAAALVAVAALATTASAALHGTAAAPKPASAAAWKKLVAKAKSEGAVTIYSVQNPAGLQDLANAFKAKYGISVTVNRNVDSVLLSQINTEEGTHKATADIWVPSQKRLVFGAIQNGWVTDAVGPSFFKKRFDRKSFTLGKFFFIQYGDETGNHVGPFESNDLDALMVRAVQGEVDAVLQFSLTSRRVSASSAGKQGLRRKATAPASRARCSSSG